MANEQSQSLTARWIIPVSSDPINGGSIRISGDQIVEVAAGPAPPHAKDLGDVALLPGLINAHTHLEFSDEQGPIGEPGIPLANWIPRVIAARRETTAESRIGAIGLGLEELRQSGTALAGEITTPPCQYPDDSALPDLVTFAEVLGLDRERAEERLEASNRHNQLYSNGGWSPHAPYSTTPEAIDACVRLARRHDRPLAMHIAESPDERELLCRGTGPLADTLQELGVWRDGLFPWGENPFHALIEKISAAPRVLLVHGNVLDNAEIDRLRSHPNITVVYCPRTHHFFGYDRHPVDVMLSAGIRVALGTDSRASNPDLSLWREVQFLLRHRTDLPPSEVLKMATINAADALGRRDLGRIEPGSRAIFASVPSAARNVDELYADLCRNDCDRFQHMT